jgi:enterochelin esterase-like enzyme
VIRAAFILILVAFRIGLLHAQEMPQSPRLAALNKAVISGNTAAVATFWQEITQQGTPLIEPTDDKGYVWVTFLWRSAKDTVVVLNQESLHTVRGRVLVRLAGTDVWFRTYRMRDDGRFFYQFSVDDPKYPFEREGEMTYPSNYQIDPLNPKVWRKQFSVAELPNAASLDVAQQHADIPKGERVKIVPDLKSEILGNTRRIFIYKPPGYDAKAKPYPVLFFGSSYLSTIPLPIILDNLIAQKKVPPVVAALIDFPDQATLDREMECNPKFDEFLVKELVPKIRRDYRVTTDPSKTIIGGASMGGLSAACSAMRHPEIFGNVLSQSGSYWWKPGGESEDQWFAREMAARALLPVRFYISIGLHESGYAYRDGLISMLHANRHLRDVLRAKGYTIFYRETNAGHDPYNWQVTLADGLVALIGLTARK